MRHNRPRRYFKRWRTLLCVFFLARSDVSVAQSVRGVVVDPTGSPVAGVVVQLTDRADRVISQSLSNERGEFRLSASSGGEYRMRTLRIGFRPTVSSPLSLVSGQELMHQLEVRAIPFSLDTVRVAGRSSCRVAQDSTSAVFAVWEQVRTAIAATQLTARTTAVGSTIVTYERTLSPDRGRILEQASTIYSSLSRGLWKAPSPDSLRRTGYVVAHVDGSTTYRAPDLEVLSSNYFIEDHCFRVTSSADTSRIGIAFEPTRERRRVAEVKGVMWLDRQSSELRRVDFSYANVSSAQASGDAGGYLEFVRLRTGAWVITDWAIRMPVLEERLVRASGIRSKAMVKETDVTAIRVEGGQVALVTQDRDTIWARPALALSGTVRDSATGVPIAGALVKLAGTALEARTDSAGRFTIRNVLQGEYVAHVTTPTRATPGATHAAAIAFTDSLVALHMLVPNAVAARRATLSGVVISDIDGRPISDVEVTIPELGQTVFSNDRGTYRLNGISEGAKTVVARKIGYKELVTTVAFSAGDAIQRPIVLSRVAILDTVSVTENGVLPEFEDHRRVGLGKFLTRADLEKLHGRQLAVAVRELSGAFVVEARGHAWIQSKRQSVSLSSINASARKDADPTIWCPKDGDGFGSAGAKCGCYARVYVDNQLMNPGRAPEPFDINAVPPESVEAMEWYSGPAQTPAKYNTLNSVCGVLVIHTRRSK
jgi:hypothetical protein